MQVKSITYLSASIFLIDGARVFLAGWVSAPAVIDSDRLGDVLKSLKQTPECEIY
jgi:hypothetical protein